jgi:hypothetical protein
MLSLHGKEYDFCINHDILFELELLSKNINNSDIETILSKQLLLVKNKDYKIIQDVEINRTYKDMRPWLKIFVFFWELKVPVSKMK